MYFIIRRVFWVLLILIMIIIIVVFGVDLYVKSQAKHLVFDNIEQVPYNRVGLLLGTSKRIKSGRLNLYYQYRIDAAVKLFSTGKIDFILISGDNSEKFYNEPQQMRQDLIAKGIPPSKIYLDYAGFRTLDSVIRANKIFGLESFTVISQKFHNERAIAIARNKQLKAVGFNARDVGLRSGLKVQLREKLARVIMLWDLSINKNPKFYGDRIEIE